MNASSESGLWAMRIFKGSKGSKVQGSGFYSSRNADGIG
jgi:hypothetical protein